MRGIIYSLLFVGLGFAPFYACGAEKVEQTDKLLGEKSSPSEEKHKEYKFYVVGESGSNVYRSALIDVEEDLKQFISNYGIKRIYALTHKNEDIVKKVAKKMKVEWNFLALPSNKPPKLESFKKLVQVIKKLSPNSPTLFHDKDGANRTGVMAALYLIMTSWNLADKEVRKKTEEQFDFWKYGYTDIGSNFFSFLSQKEEGGKTFIKSLEDCYLLMRFYIKEKGFDASKLSPDNIKVLRNEVKKFKSYKYFEYALYALQAANSD